MPFTCKKKTSVEQEILLHSWKFLPNSVRSNRLLRGHMTSNNETVSRQKGLSGQRCKIYDVRG